LLRRNLAENQDQDRSLSDLVHGILKRAPNTAVILIGSAVRETMTWRSDIDVMLIAPARLPQLHAPRRVHLHYETRDHFLERLRDGDEFVAWAVRYGQPLADPDGWWEKVLRMHFPWPDWKQKIEHIDKRLGMAEKALADRDEAAAEEELLMAASHCARAQLLRAHIFPLSRPELPEQMKSLGNQRLSLLLSQLIDGGLGLKQLCSALRDLKNYRKRLVQEPQAAIGRQRLSSSSARKNTSGTK